MIPMYDRHGKVAPITVLITFAVAIVVLIAWTSFEHSELSAKPAGIDIDAARFGALESGSETQSASDSRFVILEASIPPRPQDIMADSLAAQTGNAGLAYLETPRSVLIYQDRTKDSWPDVTGEGREL